MYIIPSEEIVVDWSWSDTLSASFAPASENRHKTERQKAPKFKAVNMFKTRLMLMNRFRAENLWRDPDKDRVRSGSTRACISRNRVRIRSTQRVIRTLRSTKPELVGVSPPLLMNTLTLYVICVCSGGYEVFRLHSTSRRRFGVCGGYNIFQLGVFMSLWLWKNKRMDLIFTKTCMRKTNPIKEYEFGLMNFS